MPIIPRRPKDTDAARLRSSRKWRELSELKRKTEPLCEVCREALATEVHHRRPVGGAAGLALTIENLVSVCRACHEKSEKQGR